MFKFFSIVSLSSFARNDGSRVSPIQLECRCKDYALHSNFDVVDFIIAKQTAIQKTDARELPDVEIFLFPAFFTYHLMTSFALTILLGRIPPPSMP